MRTCDLGMFHGSSSESHSKWMLKGFPMYGCVLSGKEDHVATQNGILTKYCLEGH